MNNRNSKKEIIRIQNKILAKYNETSLFPKKMLEYLKLEKEIISYQSVLKYYKILNLPLKGSGGNNIKVKHNPFLINSDESNYWVGFIAADGNVNKKTNTIAIQSKDIEHILKYRDFINPDLIPFYRINKAGSNMCTIYYANKEIKNWMISKGITPNKSLTLSIKEDQWNWSMVRGLFDGDGSATKQVKITSASKTLVSELCNFLKKYNIIYYIKEKQSKHICYDIIIKSRLHFYYYLYKNAEIFLERKKHKFEHLIRNDKKKIEGELRESLKW